MSHHSWQVELPKGRVRGALYSIRREYLEELCDLVNLAENVAEEEVEPADPINGADIPASPDEFDGLSDVSLPAPPDQWQDAAALIDSGLHKLAEQQWQDAAALIDPADDPDLLRVIEPTTSDFNLLNNLPFT